MPHLWNPHFRGRESLLAELSRMLCESTANVPYHRVALCGMGGVGKTQIAVEYVRRNQTTYTAIFWILARDRVTLLQGFQEIGLSVGCYNTTTGLEPTAAAKLVLSWLRKQKDWLVIFDNLDDIAIIHGLLPESTWTSTRQKSPDTKEKSSSCGE